MTTETTTPTPTCTPSALRSAIERHTGHLGVNLGWYGPASSKPSRMRFSPLDVSDYLCSLSPQVPVGAVNQYVWTMAFAESRAVASVALRNLASLLDGIVTMEVDCHDEEPS